ncbi:MAG: PAS domain S-box protein [Candidatus Hodarchaeota archaeon]
MADTTKKNNISNKLSIRKLKESEENYRLIFDNANDLIAVFNDKFECEFINEKVLKKILGYTFEDIKGDKAFKLIHPDHIEEAKNIFTKTFVEGKGFGETRIRCKDGIYKWLQCKGRIFVKNGEKRLILISRDITDIKETEKKLYEAEAKYKLILENVNDLITIINENFQHEYFNEKTYKKLLGYSKEEIIGRTPMTPLHPEDQERAIKSLMNGFKYGEGKNEMRVKHKDGHYLWLENKGKTFRDTDGKKKAVIISRDISEHKKIQKELIDQKIELEKLNELKSEFLRRTTHELKIPLTAIKGYADLLLKVKSNQLSAEIISNLENIHKGCMRLEHIIKNIIESSKLKTSTIMLRTSRENLYKFIKSCVEELRELSEAKNHIIKLNIPENLIIPFDKEQIHEVIINLVGNAIKYTPPHGSITIKANLKNESVIVSIADNGIGFTKEEKKQIFKQFGKINHSDLNLDLGIEGSGLGLFISKQIIELHDGEIWVESEGRNKGSTFYFSLPRKRK